MLVSIQDRLSEARTACSAGSSIVTVHDFEIEDYAYLVMEFVDGHLKESARVEGYLTAPKQSHGVFTLQKALQYMKTAYSIRTLSQQTS